MFERETRQVIAGGDGKTVTGEMAIDTLMATLVKEGTKFDRTVADGLPPETSSFLCAGAPKHPELEPIGASLTLPQSGFGETVARCATLGRSQDVCQGSRFTVEGERCVVSS